MEFTSWPTAFGCVQSQHRIDPRLSARGQAAMKLALFRCGQQRLGNRRFEGYCSRSQNDFLVESTTDLDPNPATARVQNSLDGRLLDAICAKPARKSVPRVGPHQSGCPLAIGRTQLALSDRSCLLRLPNFGRRLRMALRNHVVCALPDEFTHVRGDVNFPSRIAINTKSATGAAGIPFSTCSRTEICRCMINGRGSWPSCSKLS